MIPSTTSPSFNLESISPLFSSESPNKAAFLDTTILFDVLSALTTLNSDVVPSRYWVSLTGLTSTNEPGRNAVTSSINTMNPPLILFCIRPVIISPDSVADINFAHVASFFAFCLDSLVCPSPSSISSMTTLTLSPMFTSNSPSELLNWLILTKDSDFSPALRTA